MRDRIPTTLCSIKQLFKKLPCETIESKICNEVSQNENTLRGTKSFQNTVITLLLSIFDGGRFLLDV